MRREKDIVGPEHGVTLGDLGVSLPRGVQAHKRIEIIDRLNAMFKLWQHQAASDAAQLALPQDEQVKKEQELRGQLTPLIEEHGLAHDQEGVVERKLNRLEIDVAWLRRMRDNPLLDQDSTEMTMLSTRAELKAAKVEFSKALVVVKETDSKLPSWLQHQG